MARWKHQVDQLEMNLPLLDFGDHRRRRRRRAAWDASVDGLVTEILEHQIRYGDEDDVPEG